MTTVGHATDATRELPLDPGGEVEIVLPAADLRLHGVDGDRVVIRTRSGRAIDEVLAIEAAAARIRIHSAERHVRLGPIEVRAPVSEDLEIDIPRSARVAVRTLSGDVEAAGIGGESRWATASGDLRLGVDAGPVAVESMSGDVRVVATAPIELNVRSVSGDLQLRGPRFETLIASTTSGDVRLDGALGSGGPHRISSVSGDVELVTPTPVGVETETITGDVRAAGSYTAGGRRGRRTITFGSGSVQVTIRTTSGDIRVAGRPRGDAAAGAASGGDAPLAASVALPADAPLPTAAPLPTDALSRTPPATLVAEAEAAPNLRRAELADLADRGDTGGDDHDTGDADHEDPPPAGDIDPDADEASRLDVLRALERGELDVETAARRLEAIGKDGRADG